MTLSNISRKRVRDRIHPCLTPFLTSVKSESFPSWEILHLSPSYNILIIWIISLGIPYSCSMSHIIPLFAESNAFSESVKVTYRMACHSILCSRNTLQVFIKSTQLRCLRNPACSFRRCYSTVFCILFRMILVRILLGILRRVTPLQLLQYDKSPFFGILIINPSSQSSGIFSSFHIFSSRRYSISALISGSTFSISGYILSKPAAFPFFNCDKTNCISVLVGGSKFISVSLSFSLLPSSTFLVSCLLPMLMCRVLPEFSDFNDCGLSHT